MDKDKEQKQLDQEAEELERAYKMLEKYEPLRLMRTIQPLTGTLTVEGMITDIDDEYISVAYIEDNTLTEGNTRTDGNPDNKTVQEYWVPIKNLQYQEGVTLDDLKDRVGKENWECPFRLIVPQNLETRCEVRKPIEVDDFAELTKMNGYELRQYLERLPHEPDDELFSEH